MRKLLAVFAIAAVTTACTKSSNSASTPPPAPTVAPTASASGTSTPAPAATAPASRVVFHAYNVMLDATGEPGSDRMQIVVNAAGSLRVALHGTKGSVRVCPIASIGANPSPASCATPASATPVVISATGLEVRAPSGSQTLDEVSVSYEPTNRVVHVRSENIIPKPGQSVCKDNGCNPFYELTPHDAGTIDATANWDGIATGALRIEVGGVVNHDYSAGGTPYPVPAQSQGSSDQGPPNLHVTATVKASEVAVALENEGARPLRTPTLRITWP